MLVFFNLMLIPVEGFLNKLKSLVVQSLTVLLVKPTIEKTLAYFIPTPLPAHTHTRTITAIEDAGAYSILNRIKNVTLDLSNISYLMPYADYIFYVMSWFSGHLL